MATQRISFDFDADEYKYLKMCCAKLGVKLREFASKAIIEAIEAQEDEWLFEDSLKDNEGPNHILFDREGNYHEICR